jgi:hypothetical protein
MDFILESIFNFQFTNLQSQNIIYIFCNCKLSVYNIEKVINLNFKKCYIRPPRGNCLRNMIIGTKKKNNNKRRKVVSL